MSKNTAQTSEPIWDSRNDDEGRPTQKDGVVQVWDGVKWVLCNWSQVKKDDRWMPSGKL